MKEVNQPQGHSTSGSHERYKDEDRLKWEVDFDCINKFKEWILSFKAKGKIIATEEELTEIEESAKKIVREEKSAAWKAFTEGIKTDLSAAIA